MATFGLSFILTVLCGYVCTSSALSNSYEITTKCNETLVLHSPQFLRGRVLETTPVPNLKCTVRVRVQPHQRMIISLQFANELKTGRFCRENKSDEQIYMSDPPSSLPVSATDKQFCDDMTTDNDLVSTAEQITINYFSNNTDISGEFQILLIPFHTGICNNDEHLCGTNRCIERTLQCRVNYNVCNNCSFPQVVSCGGSTGFFLQVIPGVIIVTGFVVIVTIVAYCWCLKKDKRKQRQRQLRNITTDKSLKKDGSNTPGEPPRLPVIPAPTYTLPYAPPPYSSLE